MNRSGFTVIELAIVVLIMGMVMMMAYPRIRGALAGQNVRSARAATQTYVVKARAAAVQRGCTGVFHMPSDGRVWVTVCRLVPAAGSTVDTLGPVEALGARYNVSVAPSQDSIRFDSRGMKVNFTRVTIRFTRGTIRDSLVVNEVGKVVR
jgi:prepilin-type N-terminal cleavage/methylation domain-containing protein